VSPMTAAVSLLLVNVVLGAWDTLWYHEHRARLATRLVHTAPELRLHVGRDVVYVVLYGTLAWRRPEGWLVAPVVFLLAAEILMTMADFVVEDRDRPAIGGLAPGERVLHSLMAIVYGAMLCRLLPVLVETATRPTALVVTDVPRWMTIAATLSAAGIAVSGGRDALALRGWDPSRRWWPPVRVLASGPSRDPMRYVPHERQPPLRIGSAPSATPHGAPAAGGRRGAAAP
jgi:hypothetical protein